MLINNLSFSIQDFVRNICSFFRACYYRLNVVLYYHVIISETYYIAKHISVSVFFGYYWFDCKMYNTPSKYSCYKVFTVANRRCSL